ncbi:MAG TPA: xanthine dehydrogenase, partial [Gelria sp.]|nr:xanthine dehydrogenase [Gelria sp.]
MRIIADKLEGGEEVALVTVLSSNLMQSGQPGDVMVVDQFGQVVGGDIGDSTLQEKARREAERSISKGLSRKIMLSNDDMLIEIFIKVFCRKDKLILVGSGNLVQDIYQIAAVMGYDISIIDNRPETLTRERFPLANELLLGDIVELLKSSEIDSNT